MCAGSIGVFQALDAENGWVMSSVSCCARPENKGIAMSRGSAEPSVRREIMSLRP